MSAELCRRCLLRDLQDASMEEVVHFYQRLPQSQRVTEAEYETRLNICRSCDFLQNGTCMQCGCYVEVRGAQKKGTCPLRRW